MKMKRSVIMLILIVSMITIGNAQQRKSIPQRHLVYSNGINVQVIYEVSTTLNSDSETYFLYYKNYDKWEYLIFFNKMQLETLMKEAQELLDKKLKEGEKIEFRVKGASYLYNGFIVRIKRTFGSGIIKITSKRRDRRMKVMFLTRKQIQDISAKLAPY